MKITSVKDKLHQTKTFDGLVKCEFEYNIKSATARMDYTGPCIPPEVWHQILSFFKWTYTTTHSESQVRLYVNHRTRTWEAWAYPQKARTGMTSTELDNEDSKRQREQFPDSEGWLYFGTVHHHCSAGAFQSSTDEANERGQDGMHITIGLMDKKQYDLHARFYLNGASFEPDMSLFWDIGTELMQSTPEACWDIIARHQMTIPSDAEFPEAWKTNLVEEKPVAVSTPSQYGYYNYESPYLGLGGNSNTESSRPWHERMRLATENTIKESMERLDIELLVDLIANIEDSDVFRVLERNCNDHSVEISEVASSIARMYASGAMDSLVNEELSKEIEEEEMEMKESKEPPKPDHHSKNLKATKK